MPEKLLVPLDGSKLSKIVLPYVEELAVKFGYEIIFFNVRSPAEDPYHPDLREYLQEIAEQTRNDFQIYYKNHEDRGQNAKAVIMGSGTLKSNPAKEILDYADNENIAMIIMATHGRTGISLWALGSVAEKVVRASQSPVLLVRANVERSRRPPIRNILVPLDGSRQSETVLSYVGNLAFVLKAKITLFHIITQPYHSYTDTDGIINVSYSQSELAKKKAEAIGYLEKAGEKIRQYDVTTTIEVKTGQPSEEIILFAEENDFDVIAMSTHGCSGFHSAGHGSVTDKVLHSGKTPLLLARK
jgi:nucleotide-binding universal stress UspA family protein